MSALGLGCASSSRAEWKIDLPEGGVGFNFGNLVVPPLKNVFGTSAYSDQAGFGFVAARGLSHAGGQWPDPLTGTYVGNLTGKPYRFKARIADGEYLVWLATGKMVRADAQSRRFLLELNDRVLVDETPGDDEFGGDKYLYRFLWTQYSEKPHALWLNYIDKMYPAEIHNVQVTDGAITVEAANYFLSALIAVPITKKAAFEKMVDDIRRQRIRCFEQSLRSSGRKPGEPPDLPARPERRPGDGDVLLYVPRDPVAVNPWTGPSDEERRQTKIEAAGALGQKVVMVLAVVPFADLGTCTLVPSDLKGPGVIPAGNIKGYYKNYRFNGKDYGETDHGKVMSMPEMCLVPTLTLELEKGVTFSYWLRMEVPADAKPGVYTGTLTLQCAGGKSFAAPVEFEVYPFRLEPVLPVSYGFWGTVGTIPQFLPESAKAKLTEQRLEVMVDLGLTATCVDVFSVKDLRPDGSVELDIQEDFVRMVKQAGMGRRPEQAQLVSNIMASMGRQIAVRLPGGGGRIWNNPGIEIAPARLREVLQGRGASVPRFLQEDGAAGGDHFGRRAARARAELLEPQLRGYHPLLRLARRGRRHSRLLQPDGRHHPRQGLHADDRPRRRAFDPCLEELGEVHEGRAGQGQDALALQLRSATATPTASTTGDGSRAAAGNGSSWNTATGPWAATRAANGTIPSRISIVGPTAPRMTS